MEEKKNPGFWERVKKTWSRVRKPTLIVLCVLESVTLLLLLVLTVGLHIINSYASLTKGADAMYKGGDWASEDEYNASESNNPDIQGDELDPSDIDWGDPATQIGGGKDVINILLVGQDRREGEGRCRSDSMILCTINKSAKTLTMTSFMRDMYVQIPGYSDNRINASYAFGGMELLDQCLNVNFGIVVDGNIEVDFSGFQEAIDIVGGVDIELTAAEAQYLNRRGNWDLENNAGQWNLTEGLNHLNGSQALAYSRIRYVGNGDYGRTNRQRTVLTKLLEKAKGLSLSEADKLLKKILPLLATDLTEKQIVRLVMEMLPVLSDLSINTQQIPADGAHYGAYVREMAVLIPDLEKNRAILAEIMKE